MGGEWRASTWGEEISLEYGKAIRGYSTESGSYRVFGTNGPVGWTSSPLAAGPGVILGRKGAYRGVHFSPDPFWVIDTAYYVRQLKPLDMRWLYYAIIHHKLGEIDDGSPIPSTTRAAVYVRDLDVPPLPEQRAIAHILGTLDDKIELNRRMAATLEEMARAIFKSWFIDFDPVNAKAENRPTNLPPEIDALFPDTLRNDGDPIGWVRTSFADTVRISGGGTPKTSVAEYWSGNVPWYSVTDAPEEKQVWVTKTAKAVTQKGIDSSSSTVLPMGTTIISARGTVGKLALTGVPMAMNQSCYALSDKSDGPGYFVYFSTHALVDKLKQRTHGSVFDTITRETLAGVQVTAPPSQLVRSFDFHVEPLMKRLLQVNLESNTLAAIRDALLPKLISGVIRVTE